MTARAARIAAEAIELPVAQREPMIERLSRGDTGLAREIRRLLDLHDRDPGFLIEPVIRLPEAASLRRGLAPGTAIGAYQVVALLGSGGMADVYEARRVGAEEGERRVAIKVVRPGPGMEGLTARFAREVETLARLDHPGIAKLLDAGVFETPEGPRPYCVMEMVRGEAITVHARERNLSTSARLGLFAQVCEAVEHAHFAGVMHRDIKPANILVSPDGRVRVLDFGVAKSVRADSLVVTMTGEAGSLIGTLAYMSPEQAGGPAGDVDLRTDVYSLGALLFELIAGRPPHEPGTMPVPQFLRVVQGEDAPDLGSMVQSARGDLALVAATALRRDRTRRYESVSSLLGDVRRLIRGEPVGARGPDLAYLLGRFAQRRPAIVAGAAAGMAMLLIGGAVAGWQAYRAVRAEHLAHQRLEEVRAVAGRMAVDLFDRLREIPGSTKTRRLVARQAVDDLEILVRNGDDDAETLSTLGTAYIQLGRVSGGTGEASDGDDEESRRMAERAIEIFERLAGEHPDQPRFAQRLATAYRVRAFAGGDPKRVRDADERARAIISRLAADEPGDHEARATLAYSLISSGLDQSAAGDLPTDLDRAVALYEQFVRDGHRGSELGVGIARRWRAFALRRLNVPAWEAEARAARDILAGVLADHPDETSAARHLSQCDALIALEEARQGQAGVATERIAAAVARLRAGYAADTQNSLCRRDLAHVLMMAGQVSAALADQAASDRSAQSRHILAAIGAYREAEATLLQGDGADAVSEFDRADADTARISRVSLEAGLERPDSAH